MTNAPISDVTNLTISNLSEPVEGVCSGTMDKHGFVRVGEEKYFLGLDVLQACGFASIQYKDGAAIRFAWVPARPSNKIAVVIAIDGRTGKADDTALLKALEAKPAPKKKSKSGPKPKGKGQGKRPQHDTQKPQIRGQRPQRPPQKVAITLAKGDKVVAQFRSFDWEAKPHAFGHAIVTHVMIEDSDPENPLFRELEAHEVPPTLYVKGQWIPRENGFEQAMEAGALLCFKVFNVAGKNPSAEVVDHVEEPDQAETSEPEKAPDDNIVDLTKRTGTTD